jgi:hypothetical protein
LKWFRKLWVKIWGTGYFGRRGGVGQVERWLREPEAVSGPQPPPVVDVQFFEQVLMDCGAVAWPGEIDLAPDARYAQIAIQRRGRSRQSQ